MTKRLSASDIIALQKIEEISHTSRLVVVCGTILLAIYLVMTGLATLATNSPDQIGGVAKIVEMLRMDSIVSYIANMVFGVSWYHERQGKKRAIRKASTLQKMLEKNDPNRTSSGLSDTGDTPGEDI